MRRQDREIKDTEKIARVISACECMRLGFYDDGQVYIVPLNFGYVLNGGRYTFYFHGAKEGRKIDLIRRSPYVGFEMDTHFKINEADRACGCSARFQSVIGNGYASSVEDFEEKKRGLLAIMVQNTGKDDWSFSEEAVRAVCVFKMEAEQLTCKEHE